MIQLWCTTCLCLCLCVYACLSLTAVAHDAFGASHKGWCQSWFVYFWSKWHSRLPGSSKLKHFDCMEAIEDNHYTYNVVLYLSIKIWWWNSSLWVCILKYNSVLVLIRIGFVFFMFSLYIELFKFNIVFLLFFYSPCSLFLLVFEFFIFYLKKCLKKMI